MKVTQRQYVRRWCPVCDRFTRSEISYGDEICAEHPEPHLDPEGWACCSDDWDDD